MGTVVLRFDPARAAALRAVLEASDFRFEPRPSALYLARRPGVTLTAYASGKLLLTGAQAEEYANYLEHGSHGLGLAPDAPASPRARVEESSTGARASERRPGPGVPAGSPSPLHRFKRRIDPDEPAGSSSPLHRFKRRIGSDESGKGDYFGPLVVAAVLLPDADTERLLVERGVRDSKLVPDAEAELLGSLIAARCPHEVVVLHPPRYNELHQKTGNLNKILAWAHARAIEDLLARHPDVDTVTVDQFAKGPRLQDALFERGRAAVVREAPRAESEDAAVAAASILARAEFLRELAALRQRHGIRLPKGAGPPVVDAGRAFVRRHGRSALSEVAKVHFATTEVIERRSPG